MAPYKPEARESIYRRAALQAGIHAPILPALAAAHGKPDLADGETGLGMYPANDVGADALDSFPAQVLAAAAATRSLSDDLARKGWTPQQMWNRTTGQYTAEFLQAVARGYLPAGYRPGVARLDSCDGDFLRSRYSQEVSLARSRFDVAQAQELSRLNRRAPAAPLTVPLNQAQLDSALLDFASRVPWFYQDMLQQREALLEAMRIWRGLDGQVETLEAMGIAPYDIRARDLDGALLLFARRIPLFYNGYPNQQEALLRMVQLWRKLDSRDAAIASLNADPSPEPNIQVLDPALIAFVQRVPQFYAKTAAHRNALTETVRLWRQLATQREALISLGIDPDDLPNQTDRLDRELVGFLNRVPAAYSGQTHEREALIRLVQLWRDYGTRDEAVQAIANDLKGLKWKVLVIKVTTIFKLRPLQSTELDDREKVTLPPGELSVLNSAEEAGHYRLTLINALENRWIWYVFKGHVEFLETATMLVKDATVVKARPVQSSQLADDEKASLPVGEYELRSYEDAPDNHLKVRFVKPVSGRLDWYVFKGHISLLNINNYPPPDDKPEPAPPPEPDRGVRINVPGIGFVWTNDPIIANGNFSWGEATKGGTRIPLSSTISYNIVNMARRMQDVRARLGNRPIFVTSWYRPPAVNAAVGGVPNSTHLKGYAVDFTVSGLSARSVQRILDPWWPGGLGYGPNFTHLDNRGYRARWNYS